MTLVLVNPHAQGGRVRRRLPTLAQALEPLIPIPRLHAPETPAQAQDLLMAEPVGSPVVLVGGDGSFNRWLPALLARQLRVGLLPLGSGNDLARAGCAASRATSGPRCPSVGSCATGTRRARPTASRCPLVPCFSPRCSTRPPTALACPRCRTRA